MLDQGDIVYVSRLQYDVGGGFDRLQGSPPLCPLSSSRRDGATNVHLKLVFA